MSTGDETFADVLNGFSLNSRRSRGRPEREPGGPVPAAPQPQSQLQPQPAIGPDAGPAAGPAEENASIVRAYTWTGGRTRSDYRLQIETLVSTSGRALDVFGTLPAEHQEVAVLCRQSKSVAEVGALLKVPLGVVRVLLGDMARLGLVIVHDNESAGEVPEIELLERVLRGLTKLRT